MAAINRTGLSMPAGSTLDTNFRTKRAMIKDTATGKVESRSIDAVMLFNRAGPAAMFAEGGILADVGVDVPRYVFDPATNRALGLRLEAARTNLLLYSNTFGNGAWFPTTASVLTSAVNGLRGSYQGTRFVDSGTDTAGSLAQGVAIGTGSLPYAGRFWLRQVPGKTALWKARLTFTGGSSVVGGAATFNLATGQFVSADAGFAGRILPGPFGYWCCEVSATNTVAATGVALQLERANVADGPQSVDLSDAQLEQNAQCSSVITTLATQVTRAADIARLPIGPWFNPAEGTIVVEFIPQGNPAATQYVVSFRGAGTTVMNIIKSQFGPAIGVGVTGGSALTMFGATRDIPQRALLAYKNNDFLAMKTGVANYTGNTGDNAALTAANAVPTGFIALDIGNNNGGAQLDGTITRVIYFPTRNPVANLATLIS